MSKWEMVRLGDIGEYAPKSHIKAGEGQNRGKYKFFTSSNKQNKYLDKFLFDFPSLIFGTGGNASIHYCDTPFSVSTDCLVFYTNDPTINLKTIYRYLNGNIYLLEQGFKGAGLKHISKKYLSNEVFVPLPSPSEQQKIVDIFDCADDLIQTRKAQIDKLDLLIKSQFIEMFGSSAKDSDSWPEMKINDISKDMRTGPFGSALLHSEFVDNGVFVLGIDNAVENHFSYNRMRYITEEKYEQLKRYTVHSGDVIITIMGTIGRSAVIPDNFPKAINTKHLACLTLKKNSANPYFICYALQVHPLILKQLQSQSKGAIMAGLNLNIIKNLRMPVPPLKLQNKFVDFFIQINRLKDSLQQSHEKLELNYKSLTQKCFRGEIF